jgi:glucose-6-phosphate isomerase
MPVKLNDKYLKTFLSGHDKQNLKEMWKRAETAFDQVVNKTGAGGSMLGWLDLPEKYDKKEFARIKAAAKKIRENSKAVVVVGIGGSYLGARAAIEFIKSPLYNDLEENSPKIYFLGNSISSDYLSEVISICEKQDFSVIIISKSGTTTEPAIVFRILRRILEKKYKAEARERIFTITDKNAFRVYENGEYILDKNGRKISKSKLKELSDLKKYETFTVPEDVGGRYSVLTAVGLLPIAVAGIDIDEMMEGAAEARKTYLKFGKDNDCLKYAVLRNLLYEKGKKIEIMVAYEPALTTMNEWWKQLFGESEGKDKKGIYPSSVVFSTDLHSLGQFIQDGARIMFETVIHIKEPQNKFMIPADSEKIDGMEFVDGKALDEVNFNAMLGTVIAHTDGGTPNMILTINKRDASTFGSLAYFFELACAVSGYILGVNPFDQPGVEAYKINMFALLDTENPKYDDARKNINGKI